MTENFRPRKWMMQLLSGLLVLLGFSACSSSEDEKEYPPLMYGTLTTEFHIKGKVVDSENKEAGLPGICVLVRPNKLNHNCADTLYTDANGEFGYTGDAYSEDMVRIIYEDTKNGEFKKDSLNVRFEYSKSDGCYEADIDIEMEREI